MYENEIYSNSETNTSGGGSPYFDYTTYPTGTPGGNGGGPAAPQGKKPREKKPGGGVFRKVILSVSLGLCFGLFAGLGFYAVQLGTGQAAQTESRNTQDQGNDPEKPASLPDSSPVISNQVTYVKNDIKDVVKEVMPAMVSIVNNYTSVSRDLWGQTYSVPGVGSGSGIIVGETEEELLLVTNNHVVESATSLEVTFIDGSTAEASIKGQDSDMDLAVISVPLGNLSDETRNAITIATLGDSDALELGDPVIAIGNALGYGQSVTDGIISALNRVIELEDGSRGTFIQTNAAINPGTSGGALLNIKGEVIGINSNKIGDTKVEGMGYAIPISAASPIIAELMERQTRVKVADNEMGYMGITMQNITDQYAELFNAPQGALVYSVEKGSAAEKAGILQRDIIVKLDGQRIYSREELKSALQYYRAGENVTVTVQRVVNGEYETFDLEVTLGVRPDGVE